MEEEIAVIEKISQTLGRQNKHLIKCLTELSKGSMSMTVNVGRAVIRIEKTTQALKSAYDRYYYRYCQANSLPSAAEDKKMIDNIERKTRIHRLPRSLN